MKDTLIHPVRFSTLCFEILSYRSLVERYSGNLEPVPELPYMGQYSTTTTSHNIYYVKLTQNGLPGRGMERKNGQGLSEENNPAR